MSKKKSIFAASVCFALLALVILARSQTPTHTLPSASTLQHSTDATTRYPLVDDSASEPLEPNARAKRQKRGAKHDKSDFWVDRSGISDGTVMTGQVVPHLPAFPADQSTAILIGTITNAHAFLSNDKTGIYSELSVHVDEILKNNPNSPFSVGSSIEFERKGGRIRSSNGRIHVYKVAEQGMPAIGARCVLFLEGQPDEPYHLITGYTLAQGHVVPLDILPNPAKYEGTDENTFLKDVRVSISTS